jgi:hypothetical protein
MPLSGCIDEVHRTSRGARQPADAGVLPMYFLRRLGAHMWREFCPRTDVNQL